MLHRRLNQWLLGATFCLLGVQFTSAQELEELCAEVKIEILQELTLERQGFEAVMRITNGLDTFALEDVKVDVHFTDEDGLDVVATSDSGASDAAFFIRQDDSHQVTGLQTGADGQVLDGSIAQRATAEIRWLIIPTATAAGQSQSGELFFVGATLSYTFGGEEEVINVAPDSIVVKPQPKLSLDYFLTEDVVGDDAFTPEIEAPEPYTLGVRVRNNGYGSAGNLTLESAQPTIVENEQGLAIDFKILASFLEDQPAEPTLLMNFGEIASQDVVAGRWVMQSSLSGKFTDFSASFTHADALGGALTSLLEATNAHLLAQNVKVELPGRDDVLDYLAMVQGELYVLESEPTGLSGNLCEHCVAVEGQSGSLSAASGNTRQLTTTTSTGFVHVKLADPYAGSKVLSRVVRGDGKVLADANGWLSQTRADDNRNFDHFINVFDWQSEGSYTLYFSDAADLPQAPVIQAISDRTTYEGGQIGFLVQSSDANDMTPVLSHFNLPTGANFDDKGTGVGVFSWFPQVGQAGEYSVTFKASDGALSSERSVNIQVNPSEDIDGDGLNDAWEQSYFGDLSRDGSDDSDGDGRTDLEEHDQDTDPTLAELAPGIPQIVSPIFDSEVLAGALAPLLPSFVVNNANHPAEMTVRYVFEVFGDESLTELIASGMSSEGAGTTAWDVTASDLVDGASFTDNQFYYWRVRAETDELVAIPSAWNSAQFFINTANDAPSKPQLSAPAQDSVVADVRPTLSVSNSNDIDGDRLRYAFELFHESDISAPISHISNLLPGGDGHTDWSLPVVLLEDSAYIWQVTVTDEHGAETLSDTAAFLVSLENHQPTAPSIAHPAVATQVTDLNNGQLTLSVSNGLDPEGQPLTYQFEVDQINTFNGPSLRQSPVVNAGIDNTDWTIDGLEENTTYYWRVKVSDGVVESDWIQSSFTVNTVSETPSTVTLLNPIQSAVVENLQPMLEVSESTDPDGDSISYEFEVYRDSGLTDLLTTKSVTNPYWSVDFDLDDNTRFYWRARSVDATGLASPWTVLDGEFVTNENGINDAPQFTFVLPTQELTVADTAVTLQWTDEDPDSNATIDLYYQHQGAKVSIVAGIAEDLDSVEDQFVWDVSGLLPGRYQVIAEIADEQSTITVNACCDIIVPSKDKTLSVNALSTLITNEQTTSVAKIEVALDQEPAAGTDVTVNLSLSDSTEAEILGQPYLHFTTDNWQQPQVVEVIGVDDCEVDGDTSYQLHFSAIESNDEAYQNAALESLTLVNTDNEVANQTLLVCSYQLQQQLPVNGTTFVDFTYKAVLTNTGASLQDASAQLLVLDSPIVGTGIELIEGGSLSFTNIISGQSVASNEVFVLRYDPTNELPTGRLQWQIADGVVSDVIEGNSSNNTLIGTDADDILDGKAGNDTLRGGAGNDTLIGGDGADYLYGEEGDDRFVVNGLQNHADRFNGGDGLDTIVGGAADDGIRISNFSGTHTVEIIDGAGGDNWILGTSANNTLDFSTTTLLNIIGIDALAGNDTVHGSQADDFIVGGAGSDYLYGNGGDDTFYIEGSDAGYDRVLGGEGVDRVLGSTGIDVFRFSYFSGDKSVEIIDGVSGADRIEGSASNNTLDFRNTQLLSIEKIYGAAGNDTIYGSNEADVIEAGIGSDYNYGEGGDDQFLLSMGDTGYDRYNGGSGEDSILGTPQDDQIRMAVFSGTNTVERIDGDGGLNTIVGNDSNNTLDFTNTSLISIHSIDGAKGNDTLRGSQSDDLMIGGLGGDYVFGNGGDDVFVVTPGDTGFDRYSGGEGTDKLLATSEDDDIRLSNFSGNYRVETIDGGTGANRIVANASNNTLDFRETTLLNIDSIWGMEGNDTLYGSVANDEIIGGMGSDYLYGDAGDDIFLLTPNDSGFDRINGGEGYDKLIGTADDNIIQLAYFSGSKTVEVIDGAGGIDRIVSTESNNTLDFRNTELIGVQEIDGASGNDTLYGSSSDDRMIGGMGSDVLFGDDGDDVFVLTEGDTGFDRYNGGNGIDRIEGTEQNDEIRISVFSSTNTVEIIDGGNGENRIISTTSNNTLDFRQTTLENILLIDASKGNDTVFGSIDNDTIIGGEGSDYLSGHDGDDRFLTTHGDTGYDRYTGGAGMDVVIGTVENDVIRLSSFSGANTVEQIDGGEGENVIVGSGSNNTLDFTNTELVNIDYIDAGSGNDTVKGSAEGDVIIGGTGSDYLIGNQGDDQFQFSPGDTGYDRYNGGEGVDRLDATDADDVIRISLFSGSNTIEIIDGKGGDNVIEGSSSNNTLDFSAAELVNINRIDAGSGNDTVKGSNASDVIVGGLGSDYLYGNGGDDTFLVTAADTGYDLVNGGEGSDQLLGTDGDDVIRFSNFSGSNTVESISGAGGRDVIQGTTGNNTLDFSGTSLVGIATIDASTGNDTLKGSTGDDQLIGGAGNDNIQGMNGADIYHFNRGDGIDSFEDNGTDRAIDRVLFGVGIAKEDIWLVKSGNHIVVYLLAGTETITLKNSLIDGDDAIELLVLENGETLSLSDSTTLIDWMTSVGVPAGGILTLTAEQQAHRNNLNTSTWQ